SETFATGTPPSTNGDVAARLRSPDAGAASQPSTAVAPTKLPAPVVGSQPTLVRGRPVARRYPATSVVQLPALSERPRRTPPGAGTKLVLKELASSSQLADCRAYRVARRTLLRR